MIDHANIRNELLKFGKEIDPMELFPVVTPEAFGFAVRDPYAFCISTALDRGTKADIIWTIPYDISQYLGHLDVWQINKMSLGDLTLMFSNLPRKPRYINDAPRTVKELTFKIADRYQGDATLIWEGRTAREVNRFFQSLYGVGPGIANMAVLLIEKAYGVRFSDLDRRTMDIKPDVQTKRVLYRLGIASEQSENAAIKAARELNPSYPGDVDAPLWIIGRKWCLVGNPRCDKCAVRTVCPKILP